MSNKYFYFGRGNVTNDLYLSTVAESRAELRPRQSTDAVAIPGVDIPGFDIPGFGIPGFDIPGFDMPGLDLAGTLSAGT